MSLKKCHEVRVTGSWAIKIHSLIVLYVMISEVVKDTKSSWLRIHNPKSMWMAQGSQYVPKFKMSAFWNDWKGVENPHVLYVMILEVLKDTRSSWLDLHNQKIMWMAPGSLYVQSLKMSAFWNDWKGVKNPHVLYVIIAGVIEDTGGSWLRSYNL